MAVSNLRQLLDEGREGISVLEAGVVELVKRVKIPVNSTTPPQLVAAITHDPWSHSGKYALGWVWFGLILVCLATSLRVYNYWGDKIRTALYKEDIIQTALSSASASSPAYDYSGLHSARTEASTRHFFPSEGPLVPGQRKQQATVSAIAPVNNTIAFFRFIFYRPVPRLKIGKRQFTFPSFGVMFVASAALLFSILYCFLPHPLFYESISYGSPPLAVRAGMLSIGLMPWIVALASKANFISFLTGISHERLIVMHRWGAYLCTVLAVIHAVPYWYQSAQDPAGFTKFKLYFHQHYYIFTTGIASLAPLLFLVAHSLPLLRNKFYEVFVVLHIPVAWIFMGLLFWHCNNYLTSWGYLYATVIMMVLSWICRLFYLNWMNPLRASWLIGEESAVTILPENAVKVTIPTQTRWKPGQYAYLRMPGISVMQNHPFTIASLCSEDFPSEYGHQYRDLTLVFRPFGGFTKKVFDTATEKGPYKTYRAFIEGPYGGMQRQMSSFDHVMFFAGGSGITAIASQLLDLVKRMRDGKATTRTVHVVWAMKRPEIMEWFKEELRICREYAPPGSVHCHFFITASKRDTPRMPHAGPRDSHRLSGIITDKIDAVLSSVGTKRHSALMQDRLDKVRLAHQDLDIKADMQDGITALPQAHLASPPYQAEAQPYFPPPPTHAHNEKPKPNVMVNSSIGDSLEDAARAERLYNSHRDFARQPQSQVPTSIDPSAKQSFNFGFEAPPTKSPKALTRFASLADGLSPTRPAQAKFESAPRVTVEPLAPTAAPHTRPVSYPRRNDGWRTEYGRPDIPFMLKDLNSQFSKRTCVYVCGPPEMREGVARTVADLQRLVWNDPNKDEIFLHAENYSI